MADQQPKLQHILSTQCSLSMGCESFFDRWDRFKKFADGQVGKETESSEYELLNELMTEEWKRLISQGLEDLSKKEGKTAEELKKEFVEKHLRGIRDLKYDLDEGMVATLTGALERYFICDIGPAPFSIHALLEKDRGDKAKTVTVSEHCLQMATHWLRHPPSFFTVEELDELVVLSLFHDVFYFDDFPHHDQRAVELFEDYLVFDTPRNLVENHLKLSPEVAKLKEMKFDSPLEALQQEWVQMDWYLSMVNMGTSSNPGLAVILPLEFFHHMLGRFMTRDRDVIAMRHSLYTSTS